jgi:hypothetical protein
VRAGKCFGKSPRLWLRGFFMLPIEWWLCMYNKERFFMNQFDLLQSITKYLARFSEQVQITNAAGTFHLNIHAESLLVGLLNATYDLELVNLNHVKSGNYSAIDLLDEKRGIAFQITSTRDMDKIKKTIAAYFTHRKYEKAPILKIYMLVRKISNSQVVIDKFIVAEKKKLVKAGVIKSIDDLRIYFSVEKNIMDKESLFKDLVAFDDFEKIKRVDKLLQQQFDQIGEANDLSIYHDELQSMYYEVVMNDEKGMTLDQVYVEPGFSIHFNSFGDGFKSTGKKFRKADHGYKVHEFLDDYLKGGNYLNCVDDCRMFLILGYPGQGKSSFVKKFVHDYIKSGQNQSSPIYCFQLRSIRNVKAFIDNPLEVLYEEACSSLETEINKFKFKKSFLVLDGLDELYMRDHLKLEDIDRVCKEFIMLTEKYRQLKIILTSRYGYVDDERLYREKVLIIQLAEFSLADQHLWLNNYLSFHPDTWLTPEKLNEFDRTEKYNYIRELIKQPILLHMMAAVHQEVDGTENRARIYDQLFTELINRKYSKDGQIEILKTLGPLDLREFLRELAFSIYQTGEEYITKSVLLKLKSSRAFLTLLPGEDFIDNIKGVMISFYFKETRKNKVIDNDEDDKSNYAIEFLHKSLKEYLVAEKIVYTLTTEFLEKRNRSGKYLIDDGNQALELIHDLFSQNSLSDEIRQYVHEIVQNDKTLPRELLCDRILMHLEYYLSKNFLYEFDAGQRNHPFDMSSHCFSGLWNFVSALGLTKNYLYNHYVKLRMIEMVGRSRLYDRFGEHRIYDFSFQDFSVVFLENITFSHWKFFNVDFSDAFMDNVKFENCMILETSFLDAKLLNSRFSRCEIKKCSFVSSVFSHARMEEDEFYDCNFEEAGFEGITLIAKLSQSKFFYNCNFNRVTYKNDSVDKIKARADGECTFDNLIRFDPNEYLDNEWIRNESDDVPPSECNGSGRKDYKRLLD